MALWVFGYGSLMWNPGFEPAERCLATLPGYARSFCMWSIHHRGTQEDPGLVLALDADPDAACDGVGFRVADGDADQVLSDLRARELISSAYLEKVLPLTLNDGRVVDAICYVINRDHQQYCTLTTEEQAQVIARAVGGRGPNTEYLYATVDQLEAQGIPDAELAALGERVRTLAG